LNGCYNGGGKEEDGDMSLRETTQKSKSLYSPAQDRFKFHWESSFLLSEGLFSGKCGTKNTFGNST